MNLVERLIEKDRESPKRILVVGDGMTDVYIHGKVVGRGQEGCPKFVSGTSSTSRAIFFVPGGAENAARSLSNWRTKVDYIGTPRGFGPTKTRYIDDGRCVFREDADDSKFDVELVRSTVIEHMWSSRTPNAVLLSDYDKGMLSPGFIQRVVFACKEHSIPCVADCKRAPEVYAGCILKGNSEYFGKYAEQARRRDTQAITTVGYHLPIVWDRGEVYTTGVNRSEVKCANHVGAGDCFAAHLTLALAHGFPLKEAAAIAHSAGRVYVQHPHNRPPTPAEIAADMSTVV